MDFDQSEFNKEDWIRMSESYTSNGETVYRSAIGKIRQADPPSHAQVEFEDGREMTVPFECFETL